MYRLFDKQRNKGDFSILPELHATLSGLKVGKAQGLTATYTLQADQLNLRSSACRQLCM